jgi:hypothetical protein
MTCPSYSGAATCRTVLSARLLPGSSPTPRVHESDETTVRPMRGEAPGAPARVPECTTQQESCQLLHTHVTASPRRCWRHARRQGRPRPTSIPWRDWGQGVHLPPTPLSLRGASHGARGSEVRCLWQRRVAAKKRLDRCPYDRGPAPWRHARPRLLCRKSPRASTSGVAFPAIVHRKEGRVSKVEMTTPVALICKA